MCLVKSCAWSVLDVAGTWENGGNARCRPVRLNRDRSSEWTGSVSELSREIEVYERNIHGNCRTE